MKFLICFISVVFMFSACKSIHEIPELGAPLEERLHQYLDECEQEGFTGSVLVSVGDSILITSGYGFNSKEEVVENTSKTIYDIGSITKQFTAAGILKMEMEGLLSVSDEAGKYITELNDEKSKLTIHQLLTHSAGLKGSLGFDTQLISTEDFIDKVNNSSFKSTPGEEYAYSNVGYSLLGIIIEKVSQQTYETYMREHLFLPAGMENTGYILPNWDAANMSLGYRDSELPTDKNWNDEGPGWHLKANGGILSNIEDMHLWHQALLGEDVLNETAKTKLYTRHIAEDRNGSSHYGYGWAIFNTLRDTDLIAHNGGNGTFFADFWRFLEDDVTIIIMSNRANNYSEGLASQLNKIIFPR